MPWVIEVTDEFQAWWVDLSEGERIAVTRAVTLLEERGPSLGRPHVDSIKLSRHGNLKELRIAHHGSAYRVLFAFDPRQVGVLLMGGRKPDRKWYKTAVREADRIYERYLREIESEGLLP